MSFQSASKELGRDKQFTSMVLIGGYDCDPNNARKGVDLRVKGGAIIEKSLCVVGNLNVAGMLSSEMSGNLLTGKIQESELMEGIQVCGNLMMIDDSVLIGGVQVPSGSSIKTPKIEEEVVGSGISICGEDVNINGNLVITDNITVSLPIYANNASAILGGLSIGTMYRIGGDPDFVCVVH